MFPFLNRRIEVLVSTQASITSPMSTTDSNTAIVGDSNATSGKLAVSNTTDTGDRGGDKRGVGASVLAVQSEEPEPMVVDEDADAVKRKRKGSEEEEEKGGEKRSLR